MLQDMIKCTKCGKYLKKVEFLFCNKICNYCRSIKKARNTKNSDRGLKFMRGRWHAYYDNKIFIGAFDDKIMAKRVIRMAENGKDIKKLRLLAQKLHIRKHRFGYKNLRKIEKRGDKND